MTAEKPGGSCIGSPSRRIRRRLFVTYDEATRISYLREKNMQDRTRSPVACASKITSPADTAADRVLWSWRGDLT